MAKAQMLFSMVQKEQTGSSQVRCGPLCCGSLRGFKSRLLSKGFFFGKHIWPVGQIGKMMCKS